MRIKFSDMYIFKSLHFTNTCYLTHGRHGILYYAITLSYYDLFLYHATDFFDNCSSTRISRQYEATLPAVDSPHAPVQDGGDLVLCFMKPVGLRVWLHEERSKQALRGFRGSIFYFGGFGFRVVFLEFVCWVLQGVGAAGF